MNHTGMEIYKL